MCNPSLEYGGRLRGILAPPAERERQIELEERVNREIADLVYPRELAPEERRAVAAQTYPAITEPKLGTDLPNV